jgi:RNA polymerase sigma factor (sigma-70 family)
LNNHHPQTPSARENDADILMLIAKPDTMERGFRLLLQTYQSRLYSVLYQILQNHNNTDEVLQNTFIKVYRYITNFRQDAQLYTWLYRIAINESFSFLQKEQKHQQNISIDNENFSTQIIDNQSFEYADKAEKLLKKAIETLPDKQRQVFVMRYYNETPYEEMSTILDTSVGALKASYHHAVKKVEIYIKQHL